MFESNPIKWSENRLIFHALKIVFRYDCFSGRALYFHQKENCNPPKSNNLLYKNYFLAQN